ncbi:hypothetical protein OAT84_04050 [Gammaproteobacteria bacterium]|nr:hypothetical protein [Gammaproteobacteria bacterium]
MNANNSEHLTIGYLGSPHGIKGGLSIMIETIPFDIALDENALLRTQNSNTPLQFDHLEAHHKKNVIYLCDIQDRTLAQALVGSKILYPKALFFENFPDQIYGSLCEGYDVYNQNSEHLGTLDSVSYIDDLPIATVLRATNTLRACVLPKYVAYIDHIKQELGLILS